MYDVMDSPSGGSSQAPWWKASIVRFSRYLLVVDSNRRMSPSTLPPTMSLMMFPSGYWDVRRVSMKAEEDICSPMVRKEVVKLNSIAGMIRGEAE